MVSGLDQPLGQQVVTRIDAAGGLFGGRVQLLLVAALMLAGGVLRSVELDNPYYEFHATRQHRAAILARARFYALRPPDDPARGRVAERAASNQGSLELPVTETLVGLGYALIGEQRPAVSRVLTSAFWLLSGLCLYLLARLLLSPDGALLSLGYHVLSPFAVVASRSFQPESLMVLCTTLALLCMVRYHQAPSRGRFWAVGLVSAGAVLVKPVAIFFVAPVFGLLALKRHGLWEALRSRASWGYASLCLGAPLAYYAGLLLSGELTSQAAISFQPELLSQRGFWIGWRRMIDVAHGLPWGAAALAGALLAPRGARLVLAGLWVGYGLYGLVFNYHISTHDYYQVPAIPVVALSLGALAARVAAWLPRPLARPTGVLVAVALAGLAHLSSQQTKPRFTKRADAMIEQYRQIGERVRHSDRVIFLSPNSWGGPIQFYGEIAGWYWYSLRQNLQVKRPVDKRQNKQTIETLVNEHGATYFVSTNLEALRLFGWLRPYLIEHHRMVASTREYEIFRLRPKPRRLLAPAPPR